MLSAHLVRGVRNPIAGGGPISALLVSCLWAAMCGEVQHHLTLFGIPGSHMEKNVFIFFYFFVK